MPDHDRLRAEHTYKAYADTTGGKNFQGNPMPEFHALPDAIKQAWVNASRAAADYRP